MSERYALIQGDRVINVVMADADYIEKLIASGECDEGIATVDLGPGWVRGDGKWLPPAVSAVAPETLVCTRLEFLRRFTVVERVAIRGARKGDPMLDDFMALLEAADAVYPQTDPDVAAGLEYLEALGMLGKGRREEIMG
jgi:hypothetical protein